MKKFRIPRKIKKMISGRFFLYPKDSNGGMMMAFPLTNQKDYTAVKKGIAIDFFTQTKAQKKKSQEDFAAKYKNPTDATDEEIQAMVNDVFAKEFRVKAMSMLLRSRYHPVAIEDYYIFINAYRLGNNNVASMCYDGLELGLKKSKK
jgi:hypothetical protein